MSGGDLVAILPFLVLGAAILAVTLVAAFAPRSKGASPVALAGTALALASLWPAASVAPRQVTPLLVIDGYALFFLGLILAAAIAVLLLSHGYIGRQGLPKGEFPLLVVLATFGAMAVVASDHFASFFLGLETLSIPLLGLIAYPRLRARPVEAGVKYLMLSGMSSAFLLFGMALVYARFGTLSFARLPLDSGLPATVVGLAGLALLFTGLGFKLSLVPFHMWAPDVYEGAPAPVGAFVAVVSKAAVVAVLLRLLLFSHAHSAPTILRMIEVVAIASMLAGNLLALLQGNLKRLLAYSSIAQLGYVLVPVLAGGAAAIEAVEYYLASYAVMTIGAFGVIAALADTVLGDRDEIEAYRGLLWRRPWLGGCLALMLLSLAGLPLTMGFFAKFYALKAGAGAGWWPAVGALVAGSAIGLFYYLRVIVALLGAVPVPAPEPLPTPPWPATAALAVLAAALVGLGLYPAPLIALIRTATTHTLGG